MDQTTAFELEQEWIVDHALRHAVDRRRCANLRWLFHRQVLFQRCARHRRLGRHQITRAHGDAGRAECERAGQTTAAVKSAGRSEEHTSELQSLMSSSYAAFCLKQKTNTRDTTRK